VNGQVYNRLASVLFPTGHLRTTMARASMESRPHAGAGRGKAREGASPTWCSGGRQRSGVDKDGAVAAPPAARTLNGVGTSDNC
jgi:hypothetical protein